jgi:hypothetical protein
VVLTIFEGWEFSLLFPYFSLSSFFPSPLCFILVFSFLGHSAATLVHSVIHKMLSVQTDAIGGALLLLLHALLTQQTHYLVDASLQTWQYVSIFPPLFILLLISLNLKW